MFLIPKPLPTLLRALALLLLAEMAASLPLAADAGSGAVITVASPRYLSVDRIKGIGKFTFGAALKDFPPELIQPVDPRAHGVLLKVSPYGDNYLVKNVSGLTWGSIPVAGMVATFRDGLLIDLQVALKAKKGDFYVVDRAFKDKYGPSNPRDFPVQTWSGDNIQVTLILVGANVVDPKSLDEPAQAKLELFDSTRWNEYMSAEKVKLQSALNQRYKAACQKAKADL
jgi:hypothetical protein